MGEREEKAIKHSQIEHSGQIPELFLDGRKWYLGLRPRFESLSISCWLLWAKYWIQILLPTTDISQEN